MKKILTILTSCSAVFLITASIILVNKNNGENNIQINKQIKKKSHKYQGEKLTEIGYYWDNFEKQVRIEQIPSTVKVIAAQLPPIITSLKGAFQTRVNDVNWTIPWDTKRITNMNSMFYNTTWFNNSSIADWDTSNVTDMGEMFGRSRSFNQDLSKWDVSKVKNFKKMFYNAKKYNNNDKPLKWKDKLISAQNMESMFEGASSFKYSLQDWKLEKEVNNKNFGLTTDKQPKWKEKVTKPTAPISIPSNPDISSRSDESESNEILSPAPSPDVMPTKPNNNLTPTTPNNEVMRDSSSTEDKALEAPIEPKISDKIENNDVKKENETSIEDKSNSLKNDIYKIPAKPNTIIKPASSNVAVITGTVIGTFTVLGIGVGTGYYYRKNLKNFYLNSANKTKDLYFKSKNKIKDKLSKIKSKK